jgi:hypothetical protein
MASCSFELLSHPTLAPPDFFFRPPRRPSLLVQQLQHPPVYRSSEIARVGHWRLLRSSGRPGQPSTDGGPPTRSFEQASRQTSASASASRHPSIHKSSCFRPRPRQTFDRRPLPYSHLEPVVALPFFVQLPCTCTSSVGKPYRKIEDDTLLLEKDLVGFGPSIAQDSENWNGGSTHRVLGPGNAVMSH